MDHDLTEEDKGFAEKLGVITFGMFLAMHARPELVEPGKLVRRVAGLRIVGLIGLSHERTWSPWSPSSSS
jgi:hypothetical protein